MKKVPEMLRESAATYEERNKIYGDNYKRFGHVMAVLFPHGIHLSTGEDLNRLGILVQVVSKISRYCESFHKTGHDDSLLDLAVYATMLRELDEEKRDNIARNKAADDWLAGVDKDDQISRLHVMNQVTDGVPEEDLDVHLALKGAGLL
jgi:hypothetical protein